ncbi:MAG: hypothetical protein PUF61_00555 [Spirochaetales bacterium]|nr:hypothetical protein [Spirochaetales bacterium]
MRCNLHDADIMEEGMLQGITIGEERAKLEAARNLIIKNKLDLEDIADCTALPLETVQLLAEQLKAEPVQTN